MKQLILASSSPSRRTLLKKLKIDFECISPDIDETPHPNESPESMVQRLAKEKALKVAESYPNAIIVGSDQVATCEGEIFGKPHTHEKAIDMCRRFSGKAVTFLNGMCVLNRSENRTHLHLEPTVLHYKDLTDDMIEHYLQKDQPYPCAGAIKVESLGIALLTKIDAVDPNTIIGLPLITLATLLQKEGIDVI